MDGEIITSGEQQAAMRHAEAIETVIQNNPAVAAALEAPRDFLFGLAWKGAH